MPISENPPGREATKSKAPLYMRMYFQEIYIDLVRFVGYAGKPLDEARPFVQTLAVKHGKDKAIQVSEELVIIDQNSKPPMVRLTDEVRKLAFQMLGPPPEHSRSSPKNTSTQETEKRPVEPPEVKPSRKQPKPKTPKTNAKADGTPRGKETSIMDQCRAAKEKHPDMILLFRMGDFYEAFDADAEVCHKLLGLTLTTRDREIKMAGFPHHQLEQYLHKLLKEGQRVAVCEPADDSIVKGPIKREITRVVTPGSVVEEAKPIKQPRHFVLKKFEEHLNADGLAFVSIDDVKKTTPAVAPHMAGLDFVVLRGEEKLLVTVRPNLPAKNANAANEVQKLFGASYRSVRIWPSQSGDQWKWDEFPIAAAPDDGDLVDEPA